MKDFYSFRIGKEEKEEYEELCRLMERKPKTYLRIIVQREISRMKGNLKTKFKEK